jgi:Predicted phosphatase/phosphohexomutase
VSENQPLHSARTAYDAVIFDMDGVVTDTASVHARAWKALFDEVLPRLSTTPVQPFDADTDTADVIDILAPDHSPPKWKPTTVRGRRLRHVATAHPREPVHR